MFLIGHSLATLEIAENAVNKGASLITHLFNAMLPVRMESGCLLCLQYLLLCLSNFLSSLSFHNPLSPFLFLSFIIVILV